jgi:hypothetical protein
MESGQCDELEFVSHGPQLVLESSDGQIVQFLSPVERRGAIVSQKLAREALMDRLRKPASLLQIRL